jgi:hypothetical protein
MEQQHANGVSCETACDRIDGICDEFIAELPFYADESAECTEVLNDCIDICYDMAGFSPFGSEPEAEAICFNGPLGGQCGRFARDHEHCGGTVPVNSGAECRALCETTSGAWIDDLDVICDEECGFCSDAEDDCELQCGSTTDSCYDSCLELEGCF